MDPLDRADPRRLLADYRDCERMPAARREAAWLRLQTAVHAPDASPTAALAEPPAPRRPRRRAVTLLLAAAALALLFVGLGQFLRPRELAERGNQAAHDLRGALPTPVAPGGPPLRFTTPPPHDPARSTDPQPADSQSPGSQSPGSQSTDSQSADSQSADSQSADSQSADSQSADSQSADSQSADSQSADSQSATSQSAASASAASPSADSQPTDACPVDSLAPVDPSDAAPGTSPADSRPSSDESRPGPARPDTAAPAARRRPVREPSPDHDPALGLDAELSLLRRARAALAGSPQQALQLLAEHARRFPAGHLAEERMLLRVQALCAVGERERARTAARKFARAHPDSPHTPTIAAACPE